MNAKTYVIYHKSDFDGIFCREIARKFLPEAELIGWEYGEPEPQIPAESPLYILDLSVPGLMAHPKLIWIDHHKSAIDKYPASIWGIRIDGVAACRLAWQWFARQTNAEILLHGSPIGLLASFPTKADFVNRTVIEPLAVRLAGEYDIWDKRDPDAELFQHGLRSRELTENIWLCLLVNEEHKNNQDDIGSITVEALLDAGEALQYAKTQENAGIITSFGYDIEWEGLKFLACNHARFNSHLFTAGIKPEHEALLGFNWTGKQWRVSLYHAPGKEHHDLSQIAVKFGGGGHRGACGFTCNQLPWMIA